METINSLRLYNICPNLLLFKEQHKHFKPVKYNLELSTIGSDSRSQAQLYLNVLTYKILEELFANPNLSKFKIEEMWNTYSSQINFEYKEIIVMSWVRLLSIIDKIRKILEDYSEVSSNIIFHKSIHRPNNIIFNLKIDMLMMNDAGIDLLTVVPSTNQSQDMNVISNIDTAHVLEFLTEAGIEVGKVIEISYDAMRDYNYREMFPTKYVYSYVNKISKMSENKKVNLFYCDMCPYKTECKLSNRI